MKRLLVAFAAIVLSMAAHSQTSKDIFLMPGSDFVRPGWHPRSNLNIGAGISLARLQKVPVGNEITFAYTYENAGSHGFWYTGHGSHTESVGIMRNFGLSKHVGAYSWLQYGVSSFTGGKKVQNRFYNGYSFGVTYHFTDHQGIWVQETFNKINTVPWYTSTNAGYVWSW